jgi:hypothetical protein
MTVNMYEVGETVSPFAAPGVELEVGDVLGKKG